MVYIAKKKGIDAMVLQTREKDSHQVVFEIFG
jgi:hypothetical protein